MSDWKEHQKLWKLKILAWMEEIFAAVMLLTILDSSHSKKSQKWLPWLIVQHRDLQQKHKNQTPLSLGQSSI